MRPDLDRIPLPSGGLVADAAHSTGGRANSAGAANAAGKRHSGVDHDRRACSVPSFGAGIAVVDVASDDTTTNYRAENRAEYDANTTTAAHATIVST